MIEKKILIPKILDSSQLNQIFRLKVNLHNLNMRFPGLRREINTNTTDYFFVHIITRIRKPFEEKNVIMEIL